MILFRDLPIINLIWSQLVQRKRSRAHPQNSLLKKINKEILSVWFPLMETLYILRTSMVMQETKCNTLIIQNIERFRPWRAYIWFLKPWISHIRAGKALPQFANAGIWYEFTYRSRSSNEIRACWRENNAKIYCFWTTINCSAWE